MVAVVRLRKIMDRKKVVIKQEQQDEIRVSVCAFLSNVISLAVFRDLFCLRIS